MTWKTRAAAIALIAAASAAAAAELWRGGGIVPARLRPVPRQPATFPTRTFDGGFNFCRLMFESDRREEGGTGWRTDYPGADINLSIRLSELTKISVSRSKSGEPNHVTVPIMDDALFKCPFVIIEDSGTARFSNEEVEQLRAYLQKGGFMWADDFWGTWAWEQWEEEIGRVLPPGEYPIVDLPRPSDVPHALYDHESAAGGQHRSLAAEQRRHVGRIRQPHPNVRGISDGTTPDGVDDAQHRHRRHMGARRRQSGLLLLFSPDGYAVAVDVLIYAMSH
jgi:hypothetical protein